MLKRRRNKFLYDLFTRYDNKGLMSDIALQNSGTIEHGNLMEFRVSEFFANEDYKRAKVPMMIFTHGAYHAKIQILCYTLIVIITLINIGAQG